jgi:hypothetical protein
VTLSDSDSTWGGENFLPRFSLSGQNGQAGKSFPIDGAGRRGIIL